MRGGWRGGGGYSLISLGHCHPWIIIDPWAQRGKSIKALIKIRLKSCEQQGIVLKEGSVCNTMERRYSRYGSENAWHGSHPRWVGGHGIVLSSEENKSPFDGDKIIGGV